MTRHRFDIFSFIAGAATVAVALLVLLDAVTISAVDLRIVGPVVVLALGASLLIGGGRERPVASAASPDPAPDRDPAPEPAREPDPAGVDTEVIERDDAGVIETEETVRIERDDDPR